MNEVWKDIKGYEGRYQVSNMGRVRSVDHAISVPCKSGHYNKRVHGRILKQREIGAGYYGVLLGMRNDQIVHRLVAEAFVPGYFDGAEVNHIDEDKHNNRWDNLEWVTRHENTHYGTRNERLSLMKNKQPIEQYDKEGKFIAEYPSQRAAARATGIHQRSINKLVDTNHTAHGFFFKRKTN